LSYKYFGETNFGEGGHIASKIEQCVEGHRYDEISGGIPEREKIVFKETLDALSQNGEGGNFYFIGLDSPHYGYYWANDFDPPFKDYLESQSELPVSASAEEVLKYKKRYWNACAWVDHQVEQFVQKLKDAGRYDNAIIVVTGDHGEEFKEHGSFFHCSNLYPEQTAVPIVIKWPKGTDSPEMENMSHLDIMPSILDYMGASQETLDQLQGRSSLRAREDHTCIISTSYAGTNGQTMMFRNKDYSASFAWPLLFISKRTVRVFIVKILEKLWSS